MKEREIHHCQKMSLVIGGGVLGTYSSADETEVTRTKCPNIIGSHEGKCSTRTYLMLHLGVKE